MIKYLKRTLRRWLEEPYESMTIVGSDTPVHPKDNFPDSGMIRFEIFPAIGGRILKVNRYSEDNRGNTERHVDMYIITDSDNIGERVSKIINIQMYK